LKYEIGDKIIVLHSDEEGKVVEIINDKMVMIEVRGVKFPAYMDQIDFPYFKMFSQKKPIEKKKIYVDNVKKEKTTNRKKTTDGVFISFVPIFDKDIFDDEIVQKLKVYLINHNEEEYDFIYNLNFSGSSDFSLKSNLPALQDFYLHDILFEDVSDSPSFEFEFSLAKEIKNKAPYFEKALKIKGKQFFKKIEELKEKNEAAFSFEVFTFYPDKVIEEKMDLSKLNNAGYRMYEISKAKQFIPSAQSVVDLHIDKLLNSWEGLSNYEILSTQINAFEKNIELAILQKMPSIIFIHGVGEGVLKQQLHEKLKGIKNVKSFVNQYHHLYGYGATEVYFNN